MTDVTKITNKLKLKPETKKYSELKYMKTKIWKRCLLNCTKNNHSGKNLTGSVILFAHKGVFHIVRT